LRVSAICFWLLLSVAGGGRVGAAAGPAPLFRIGDSDGDYRELALAGNHAAYPGRFPKDVRFVAGRSDPSVDWPTIQPGPADAWAGSRDHPFRIEFNAAQRDLEGDADLKIDLVGTQKVRPPKLQIELNGERCAFELPAGPGDGVLTDPSRGNRHEVELRFRGGLLRRGTNEIVLTAVEGSWLLYDAVTLETALPAASASDIREFRAEAPPFFRRDPDGALRQVIEAAYYNAGGRKKGAIQVSFGGARWTVELPGIGLGWNRSTVLVPEVTAASTASLRLVAGGESFAAEATVSPQRKWRFFVSPHVHTDIGYSAPQPVVAERQKESLDRAIEACERFPNFVWNCEIAWQAEVYRKERPQSQWEKLARFMREGRIGLHAAYMNMLTGLCSHEELNRLFLYAKTLEKELGIPVPAATITDVPSCVGALPMVLAESGVRYFAQGINDYRAPFLVRTNVKSPFWWEGPDGSKVLALFAANYAQMGRLRLDSGLGEMRKAVLSVLGGLERGKYPFDAVFFYGAFPDNGLLDPRFAEGAAEWNRTWAYPQIILCRDEQFFETILKHYPDAIPEFKGDAGAYWEDGAASSARETALNRGTHEALPTAEKLHACLRLLDGGGPATRPPYPGPALRQAWEDVLWYDEHTWGSRKSVSDPTDPKVAEQWKYKSEPAYRAAGTAGDLVKAGLEALGARAATGKRQTVLVFNPLSWQRTDIARVVLPAAPAGKGAVTLVDLESGKETPAQQTGSAAEENGAYAFIAENVPPLGFKLFEVVLSSEPAAGEPSLAGNVLESRLFRVRFDAATGGLSSIYDKTRERELLDPESPYKANQYLYIARRGEKTETHSPGEVTLGGFRCGPVFRRAVARGRAVRTPLVESEVVLYDHLPRIDIINRLRKEETCEKEAVFFAFPFKAHPRAFSFEGPDAVVRLPWDMLKGACLDWFAVQHWVDISGLAGGVTWACPDTPLASLGALPGDEQLTTFLPSSGSIFAYVMNNSWDTNYRAGQGGDFTFRYSLTTHAGGLDPVTAARFGWEAANPLRTVVLPRGQKGTLQGPLVSFCAVSADNAILLALKQAEDGDGWIARLWETGGRTGPVELRFPLFRVSRAVTANLGEENGEALRFDGHAVSVPLKAHGLATVRLWFQEGKER
jgi:alpha-mannosidase